MKNLKDLDVLWATVIYDIEIDYTLNISRFYVRSLEGGIVQFFEVSFKRMFKFHMTNENVEPGRFTELTEIYSKETKKGYEFTIIVLHENYTIDIECEDWSLRLLEEYNENE